MFSYVNEGTRKKKVPRALESLNVPWEPYLSCPTARQCWMEQSFIQGISLLQILPLKNASYRVSANALASK